MRNAFNPLSAKLLELRNATRLTRSSILSFAFIDLPSFFVRTLFCLKNEEDTTDRNLRNLNAREGFCVPGKSQTAHGSARFIQHLARSRVVRAMGINLERSKGGKE